MGGAPPPLTAPASSEQLSPGLSVPRVPSLELFNYYINQQRQDGAPQSVPTPLVKPEFEAASQHTQSVSPAAREPFLLSNESLNSSPGCNAPPPQAQPAELASAVAPAMAMAPPLGGQALNALNPGLAMAAAMQLKCMGAFSNLAPCKMEDSEDEAINKKRKARRMVSNRESARRSRRRKEDHINMLEAELKRVVQQNNNRLVVSRTSWGEMFTLCAAIQNIET